MSATPRTSTTGQGLPPVAGLTVIEARRRGFDVQLRLCDGTARRAWIPRHIIEDARARLATNRDLIAAVEPLGSAGMQAIALLCARPDSALSPFVDVSWSMVAGDVGPLDDTDMTELPTECYDDESLGASGWRMTELAVDSEPPRLRRELIPNLVPRIVVSLAVGALLLLGLTQLFASSGVP
ncbi:MAG: hypothetical protein KTR31_33050 [Myxococcales bacterium]|nr:hypothetical protein [Myxococcales bacterium]